VRASLRMPSLNKSLCCIEPARTTTTVSLTLICYKTALFVSNFASGKKKKVKIAATATATVEQAVSVRIARIEGLCAFFELSSLLP
jgi:hypothetical protein